MKKILALGLAAAMATATVGIGVESASAQPKNYGNDWKWKGNHHHHRDFRGSNFFFPFLLGGAVGYGLSRSYDPYYYDYGPTSYGYGDAHVQWCLAHYRTYNPATNTFFVRPGVPQECISPYSY